MSVASQPLVVGKLTIPNRLAMAPMTRGFADRDTLVPNDLAAAYYGARAAGGIGLVITEGVHVNPTTAVDAPGIPQCRTPEQVAAWKQVAAAVHAAGGKIAMQLWHTGLAAKDSVGPSADIDLTSPGLNGSLGMPVIRQAPKQLTPELMAEIVADFALTAGNAVHGADFDAVEIHGAHGYLADSFFSKTMNVRTDEFGGALANRARFPIQIVKAVKAAIGDAPLIYRFSQWTGANFSEIKFDTSKELAEYTALLKEAGVDALHPSTRNALTPAFPAEDPKRTLAGWTKQVSGLPTIAVGGIGLNKVFSVEDFSTGTGFAVADPKPALELLQNGEADSLAIGRMLITDPDFGNKILAGTWDAGVPYAPAALGALN